MKIRFGFVSNSSSTMFLIKNRTNKRKSLIDFVLENPQLIKQYRKKYGTSYTQARLLYSAQNNNFYIKAHEEKECVFGDSDGTIIGEVFDYILREGGMSESFEWKFTNSMR